MLLAFPSLDIWDAISFWNLACLQKVSSAATLLVHFKTEAAKLQVEIAEVSVIYRSCICQVGVNEQSSASNSKLCIICIDANPAASLKSFSQALCSDVCSD